MKNGYRRKVAVTVLLLLFAALSLTACRKETKEDDSGFYIYYVNIEDSGLEPVSYEPKEDTTSAQVEELFTQLQKSTDSIDYKSAIEKGISIERWTLKKEKLKIYFNEAYSQLSKEQELFLRAAVVLTMVQMDEIDCVKFYVDNQALKLSDGTKVGYMTGDDFVQINGDTIHSYQEKEITLYFPDESGTKLKKMNKTVKYDSNTSIEKLIVELLMKGPGKDGYTKFIPSSAKLLGVSVSDNICYINFDDGFMESQYAVNPTVIIYAIVDSVIEAGNVNKVQISVNGQTNLMYLDSVDISLQLGFNTDLVEED